MSPTSTPDALAEARSVAARVEIAPRLAAIWRSALGPKADRQAHVLHMYVGMGRVMRFVEEAQAALGVHIPVSAVLRLGTVAALAEAIETGRDWPPHAPLILLRAGSPEQCLYIVSTGIGLILDLCELAQHIDFPGEIWGLQPPGIDGEAEPLIGIPDIAQHYVEAILAYAPGATTHVMGYSYSGLIAYEMARLLSARQVRLGMVGLLDTTCCEKFWPRGVWLAKLGSQVATRLAELRGLPPRQALRRLGGRGMALIRHLRRRLDPPTNDPAASHSVYYVGGLPPALQRLHDLGLVGYERYRPTAQDVAGVLFRSALGDPYNCDPIAIWSRLVPRLEVVHVPGSHATMVRRPMVLTLAAEVSRRLLRAAPR